MASIQIFGRLTRDPEIRQVGDTTVARLSIADGDDFYIGRDKEPQPLYHECETWGRRAELAPQLLGKGDRVVFNGQLRPNNYTNKDGQLVKSTTIRGNYVLVETKGDRERKAATAQGGGYGGGYGNPPTDEIPF